MEAWNYIETFVCMSIRCILSTISFTMCGIVCYQLAHFSSGHVGESICIPSLIIIIKSGVCTRCTVSHCLEFGPETMVPDVCFTTSVLWSPLAYWHSLDRSTVSLHIPNNRQMPAVRDVQGDCLWPLRKWWKSPPVLWPHNPFPLR